ncbi:MAG: tripartite tricarboxylate transporter permease [Nitrospirae bacterium]|nr:tripartite tricarboxylate transporter permease [Nitrospirota bacterium]
MDYFVNILGWLGTGFATILNPYTILMMCFGMFVGLLAGALPGVTMVMAVVLTLPFTYGMDIVPAIMFLFSIYCGGVFGGAIIAILFNIPGDPMNVATTFDGHPMAKKGQAGLALGIAICSATIGGFLSALLMTFASPLIARFALAFSTVEYFAIIFLGLSTVVLLAGKSISNSFQSVFIGLFLGTVGVESITGAARFTFGSEVLMGGIDWVVVLLGLFAVGEVFEMLATRGGYSSEVAALKKMIRAELPSLKTLWGLRWTIVRCVGLGSFIGGVPGAGATIASFVGYGIEKQVSKESDKFGTGMVAGVAAPELAANASTGGAMIPLLTLGIPGSAATAIMLGAFLLHGIQPGPQIFQNSPKMIYTLFSGALFCQLILFVMGWFTINLMVRAMRIPEHIMCVFIIVFAIFGSYALKSNISDVWIMLASGYVGYIMRVYGYPVAPLILGLILGPLAEDNFMTSMYHYHNNLGIFFTRPISGVLMVLAIVLIFVPFLRKLKSKRRLETAT